MDKVIDGIYVKALGKADNQAIVFIHGFPFDHTLWDNVIDELKDEYYCISYDIRGFGNSKADNGQYTMESYTEDLENIISSLKLNKPVICGFSMGGYVALRTNEKLKGNYKALVLANTATSSDDDEGKLKRHDAISSINDKGIEPFLDKFFSVAFSKSFIENEHFKTKELKDRIMSFSPVGIKGGLLAMLSRTDTTESLKDIDIPVLLITAENDKVIPPDTMKKMADKIKNSTFVSLSDSGHVSMLENPNGFNKALKDFLESV